MIKKIIFNTAKEQFRKAFRKYKSQVKRAKNPRVGGEIGVEPYDLKKSKIKREIRSTKFMDKAAYKAAPKTKSLPKGGPRPRIFGKAYASDKAGKRSMMIPMMTKRERAANQEAISQSVRKFMKERIGRKAQGGVVVNKMLIGGLLTKGIKYGYKLYRKASGKKTSEIVKDSKVSRSTAKRDVKSGISREIKGKIPFKNFHINSPHLIKSKRRMIVRDLNKLK